MTLDDIRAWIIHLRLQFQLFLSPIFLWGFLLANGNVGPDLILGYIAFHLFAYAGGTAFNSFYDRDTGPIGGLEHPPPIPHGLLQFSIAWQLIGLFFALAVNVPVALIYSSMLVLSFAYSHPSLRFKGRPIAALVTIALGQGVLAFLAGWASATAELTSVLSTDGVLGGLGATLITVGLYPLTQIYQIEEDRRRGDLTVAAWLGPTRSFQFALIVLFLGGLTAIVLIVLRYGGLEAAALAVFLGGVLYTIWNWSQWFQPGEVIRNFKTIMRLYGAISLAFIAWITLHLAGIL